MDALKLALKYIARNKFKSAILVGCIFLTALLPIAIKILLIQFDRQMLDRSRKTPVVVGATGSRLDLTLHVLNFRTEAPGTIPFSESLALQSAELARAYPIYAAFTARGFPVVGTSLDYLDFRNLKFASGSRFAILGECVLGSQVAARLELQSGDSILTDRENVMDIAGKYPLKLTVAGVLSPSDSADDSAVFVDLKTAWVIEGLGHGHQDLEKETDTAKVSKRTENEIVAGAAVLPYLEITANNLDSFHFHGEPETFPLTAIIVVPNSEEASTILEGRFLGRGTEVQFLRPTRVIEDLMALMFRIKAFFDLNAILIAISTLLLMGLVVMMSLALRKREMETMFKIGCSRGTMFRIQFWELAIIFFTATALVSLAAWGVWAQGQHWIEVLLQS